MSNSSSSSSNGVGVAGLLGVAFVVLKLTHFIDWPWLWVLSPFWIPFVSALVVLVVLGVIFLVRAVLK